MRNARRRRAKPIARLTDLQLARLVARFYRLGERVLYEIVRERRDKTFVARMQVYVDRLDPEVLRATGGDRLPPVPLHLVSPSPHPWRDTADSADTTPTDEAAT
jgi:hypothetical protein